MNKEEIIKLAQTLPILGLMNPSVEWKKAFEIYNNDMRLIGLPSLSIGCRPCYQKVLAYCIKKYL